MLAPVFAGGEEGRALFDRTSPRQVGDELIQEVSLHRRVSHVPRCADDCTEAFTLLAAQLLSVQWLSANRAYHAEAAIMRCGRIQGVFRNGTVWGYPNS